MSQSLDRTTICPTQYPLKKRSESEGNGGVIFFFKGMIIKSQSLGLPKDFQHLLYHDDWKIALLKLYISAAQSPVDTAVINLWIYIGSQTVLDALKMGMLYPFHEERLSIFRSQRLVAKVKNFQSSLWSENILNILFHSFYLYIA